METNQLIKLLLNYKFSKKLFCGVFALDKLPLKRVRRPCSFIVNTDKSNQPGEHWVAIFIPKIGKPEYFDSYGRPPQHQQIKDFLNFNGENFIYNEKQIQSDNSTQCGLFSLFYIYYRAKGYKLNQYLKLFDVYNLDYNDKIIQSLFNKIKLFTN